MGQENYRDGAQGEPDSLRIDTDASRELLGLLGVGGITKLTVEEFDQLLDVIREIASVASQDAWHAGWQAGVVHVNDYMSAINAQNVTTH